MIRSEKHLFEASAYVNMNPVAAGLVRELGEYRYASHDAQETDLERWYTAAELDSLGYGDWKGETPYRDHRSPCP